MCVAARDLEIFHDTVLWARRFNKDSLITKELYGAKIFETEELEDLLGAMPQWDVTPEATKIIVPALSKKDIDLSNRILNNLIETASMTTQKPGFQRSRWASVLRLPQVMVDRRLKLFRGKTNDTDSQAEIVEIVWKPTIDTLVEEKALLCKPASQTLTGGAHNIDTWGIYVFERLSDSTAISAPVLAEVARFLLDRRRTRLGAEGLPVQVHNTVAVVERVARCDQPELACPFIRDLIIYGDGEDNISTWHRRPLSVGFLSSLPAKAAKELLYTMAGAIKEKMRDQNLNWVQSGDNGTSEGRTAATADGSDPTSTSKELQRPAIKVPTVKMVAQLLQKNLFIDTSSSCDVLIGLLAEARHIDMIIAIASSLISADEEPTCPPQLRTRILDALESYVVPVAARLSERRPLTEDEWTAAAEDVTPLPDVSEETSLLAMLVERTHRVRLHSDDKARLAQLIMSIPEQSAANNDRWISLFLAKNNFTLDDGERLPEVPVSLRMLASLFSDLTAYMPASIFDMLRSMVLINLDPAPGISRITESVKANRTLVSSKTGKHWLAQFDNSGAAAFGLGLEHAALQLQSPAEEMRSKLGNERGITVEISQDFILSAAGRLVIKGHTDVLDALVSKLCQRRFEGRRQWVSWRANCVPVIEGIIRRVEGFRSKGKQSPIGTRGRRSLLLPNTFRLSIKTLPIPFSAPRKPASAEVDDFVFGLSERIDWLQERRTPYHVDFARLKDVCKGPRAADLARFAVKLARPHDMKAQPSLADYLRWEMVGEFLVRAGDVGDEGAVSERRETIGALTVCEDEGLRMMGFDIVQRLKERGVKLGLKVDGKEM